MKNNNPWIKLADYGNHPHTQGLQHFTLAAAQAIVRHHRSLYGRLKLYFGGVPVYIGHPDDPAFRGQTGHTDTRAYAWIHAMEARADGLYARPVWSNEGQKLLANAHYKHVSPRWKMQKISNGTHAGMLLPTELISVGLTNIPNIAGPTIANQKTDSTSPKPFDGLATLTAQGLRPGSESPEKTHLDGLPFVAKLMGLSAEASSDEVVAAIKALQESSRGISERINLINAQLDLALERGQIALGKRTDWEKRLQEEPTAANELATLPRHAASLASHRPSFLSDTLTPYQVNRTTAQAEFIKVVEERMQKTGEDFSTAWNKIKETRKEIFLKLN